MDQRRRALIEGHQWIAILERETIAVALDQGGGHLSELFFDHPDRARRRAQELEPGDLLESGREALLADLVHDHDQRRVVAPAALHDAPKRDPVLSQDLRDLSQAAGPILDLEVE